MTRNHISLLVIGLSIGALLVAFARFGVVYVHSGATDADSRGDSAYARKLWWVSSSFGYVPSKTMLGTLYLTGRGGPQDPRLAEKYLSEAAEEGDVDAQSIYGMAVYAGALLPMDRKKGLYWVEKAAAQGDGAARNFLNVIGNTR